MKTAARHDKDTGSPDVQVAVLTRRIEDLTKHLKKNAKDVHSRRGLLQMVADRRTHLRYLENNDKRRYNAVLKKLGLKK
jgi:small subunit ribosomal protein S15